MASFLQTVRERVVIYDGAMGTNIHKHNPTLDDYWGKENCNEILVLSRPDIIRDVHASFLSVGCDVIETDTFNASRAAIVAIFACSVPRQISKKRCTSPSRDSAKGVGCASRTSLRQNRPATWM